MLSVQQCNAHLCAAVESSSELSDSKKAKKGKKHAHHTGSLDLPATGQDKSTPTPTPSAPALTLPVASTDSTPPPSPAGLTRGAIYRVLAAYKASQANSLQVTKGERVQFVAAKDQWAWVRKDDGSKGYIPGIYLEGWRK